MLVSGLACKPVTSPKMVGIWIVSPAIWDRFKGVQTHPGLWDQIGIPLQLTCCLAASWWVVLQLSSMRWILHLPVACTILHFILAHPRRSLGPLVPGRGPALLPQRPCLLCHACDVSWVVMQFHWVLEFICCWWLQLRH